MIKHFEKYEMTAYLIITFLFTWTIWITGFILLPDLSGVLRIIGSFMPSVMAVIFTGFYYGIDGVKKLWKKLILWKVNPVFYGFIFLFTATSLYIPLFICRAIGVNYRVHINYSYSGFQLTSPISAAACFLAIMIFGGPLGEEIGWRGFVLPKLQQRFNPFLSSVVLGIIWSAWHIPMFCFHIPGYDISFINYLFETIWLTVICTWLYNHTKGSLLIAVLFHTIDDFVMVICFNDFMAQFNTFSVVFWIVRLIVLLIIALDMFKEQIRSNI